MTSRLRTWRLISLIGLVAVLLSAAGDVGAEDGAKGKANRIPGDEILGEWWTENNEGRISMTRDKEGFYRGTTTCCAKKDKQGNVILDVNNPNPSLRTRDPIGMILIWKLKFEDGEYVDGHVYNPRDGKSYRIQMTMVDNETVKIRGYMGIPLLGQTQVWKRFHGAAKKAN
jgi:uncharacterized protein (DUF2147 family)